jgi:DNA-binding XRE family transcriptional regulator
MTDLMKWKKECGYTYAEMADMFQVREVTVQKICTSVGHPGRELAAMISKRTRIPIDRLMYSDVELAEMKKK